jgi:Zinc-binding dehydrogenase
VASDFNVCRLPSNVSIEAGAAIGVAFVSAVLALGICLGVDLPDSSAGTRGPDLLRIVHALKPQSIPSDVQDECHNGMQKAERPSRGDWLAIWGGTFHHSFHDTTIIQDLLCIASSTVGYIALQLAKSAGLRIICVADAVKHGLRLIDAGADVLVHRKDTQEAISIIRSITKGKLRFALDTVGKETASLLQAAMQHSSEESLRSHLTGLTGVPGEKARGVVHHKVPIKIFHESPEVGRAVMTWMEELLLEGTLIMPNIEIADGGLEGVNAALADLKSGVCSAQRIVVPI